MCLDLYLLLAPICRVTVYFRYFNGPAWDSDKYDGVLVSWSLEETNSYKASFKVSVFLVI